MAIYRPNRYGYRPSGMLAAAATLAQAGLMLVCDEESVRKAKEEFVRRTGGEGL